MQKETNRWYEILQRSELRKSLPLQFYIIRKRFIFIILTFALIPVIETIKNVLDLKITINSIILSSLVAIALFSYLWKKFPETIDKKEQTLLAHLTFYLYKKSLSYNLFTEQNKEKQGLFKRLIKLFIILIKE